jgi:pimeloyl-ACP methyl ester carboxylesterase
MAPPASSFPASGFDDPALSSFAVAQPELPLRERRVTVSGGVSLHVVEAGPGDGEPVVLLHGFPEFWWGFRKQIPALAAAGFRVVVPDQRGYNLSDKPRGVRAYRAAALVSDLLALLDDVGAGPVPLVAHDWGGAVAWHALEEHPERFSRALVVNCPHLEVLKRALWRSPAQRRRGSYLFYFQLPWFPERKIAAGGFKPFRSIFKRSSPKGTFTPEELDVYAAAAARPGAVKAMLHWYRAALWFPFRASRSGPIEVPVRLVWGDDDAALGEELIAPTAARCASCEIIHVPGAGHWVPHTATAELNGLLLDFLAGKPVRSPDA